MSHLASFPAVDDDTPVDTAHALHRRLDELHQMIYRRGGIRPVNAAIEELSKLLLLELTLIEDPDCEVPGRGPLATVLDPGRLALADDVTAVKDAFRHVASMDRYAGRLPDGGAQPIWPEDEPLRISRADVLAEAIQLLRSHVRAGSSENFDLLGTAFDIFLRGRYDHSGGLGTHLTPHAVATMLARICAEDLDLFGEAFDGPIVGDPCCGTGRFLVAAVNELVAATSDPRRVQLLESGLVGCDQSTSSIAKARINLLLLGARHPNVFTVEDSVVDEHLDALRGRLRLILTNPPFGDGKYDSEGGIERTARVLPRVAGKRRIDPALAFLARCLDLLADGGRLGIILPDGLLDGQIVRRALLGNDRTRIRDVSVEASISLPTATFALAGTVARTSALILRKQAGRHSRVFLARAEHVGYLKQGSGSVADPQGSDLPVITEAAVKTLGRKVADVSQTGIRFVSHAPLAAVLPAEEVTSLDPGRVDPHAVAARSQLRDTGLSFRDLLTPTKRRQQVPNRALPFVSVLHIDDLGAIAWHEAGAYRPATPGLEAHPGDLIVSLLNPRKLRASVIPEDVGCVHCSSEFGVFSAQNDPYEVLILLHHPLVRAQLAPLGRGTSSSRRRISAEDLLGILVPAIPASRLAALAAEIRDSLTGLRVATDTAAAAYASLATA